jgi:hypothetical protein
MGFFKSIKKKLSIFKKQLRKVLPNEIMDNPEIVAAFIIGGSIPFGQDGKSLFARGATGIGNMVSDPKGYFTDLNEKFGFGKKLVPTGQKVWTPAGMMTETKKYKSGFLKKGLEGVEGFLGEHPKIKRGAGSFFQKYLKAGEKPVSEKIAEVPTGKGYQRRLASGAPHSGFKAASTQIRPGYRNRYVQSSVYNILNNPNYKAIWSGGINSGDMISTTFTRAAGPVTKLESSRLGG